MVTADLNGDGRPDLVAVGLSSNNSGAIDILLGEGECVFHKGQTYTITALVTAVTVGDFNRDGKLDLAATTGNQIVILLGTATAPFKAPFITLLEAQLPPSPRPTSTATANWTLQ
jgi:hypothetical protein